jgi:hypothetical protein
MTTTQPPPPTREAAITPAAAEIRPATYRARRAALVAGLGTLAMAVLAGAANFGVLDALVSDNDATRTATDVLASAGLFRLGIAAMVVVVVLDVVVAWALMTFFASVHKGIATLAAWMRVAYAAVFAAAISQLPAALHLLGDASYLKSFSVDQRNTEALLRIHAYQDIWHVSLVLFGVHLVLIGWLAYRSGYVPRVFGILLAVAGAGYLVDSFAGLLIESYSINVAAFAFVGEPLLMLWLLVRGRKVSLKR